MIHKYEISGMHCKGCVEKIKKALLQAPHVISADVTLSPPLATVEMSQHVPVGALNKEVSTVGKYSLTEAAEKKEEMKHSVSETGNTDSLRPLFVISSYLVGGVLLRSYVSGDFSLATLMNNFMGGFFVLFSLFKMLDVSAFADAYSTYDIVAKRSRTYALSYPFIELALGILYLVSAFPFATNLITLILMVVGSIGVSRALLEKRAIQCACLGTSLKLPMTKITLLEDLLMGAMAALMLITGHV